MHWLRSIGIEEDDIIEIISAFNDIQNMIRREIVGIIRRETYEKSSDAIDSLVTQFGEITDEHTIWWHEEEYYIFYLKIEKQTYYFKYGKLQSMEIGELNDKLAEITGIKKRYFAHSITESVEWEYRYNNTSAHCVKV